MRFRGALAAIRLRRLISFLRRHGLYETAHSLERRTGVFFDAPHLRRLLLADRWAAASGYVLGFFKVGDCSREADTLLVRILLLRVMSDLVDGRPRHALFQRLYDSLGTQPDCFHLRQILLSMRSDRARASRLYRRLKPMAVQVILNLITNCPELKARTWLPRCTLYPTSIMSLATGLYGCSRHMKNKVARVPANAIARSFLRKRPPLIIHKVNRSGFSGAPVLKDLQATPTGPAKLCSILPSNAGMNHSRQNGTRFHMRFEQDTDPRKCTKTLQTTGEFDEPEDALA